MHAKKFALLEGKKKTGNKIGNRIYMSAKKSIDDSVQIKYSFICTT